MLSTVLHIPSEGLRGCCGGWWRVCPECRLPVPGEGGGAASRPQLAELMASGWYHGPLSWAESAALLEHTKPGTFLLRDSSDSRFPFSLSVQTPRGPISVRLQGLPGGLLRLTAEPRLLPSLPVFPSAVALVQHYARPAQTQMWIDWTGSAFSHVALAKPFYNKQRLPTLQHLARRALNRLPQTHSHLHTLPKPLQQYMQQYPYSI